MFRFWKLNRKTELEGELGFPACTEARNLVYGDMYETILTLRQLLLRLAQ